MMIERGIKNDALKVVIYGPEGIGKSTFASHFPRAVYIDTEGSTSRMDVARAPSPQSWTELMMEVDYFIQHPQELSTLVIDTADWAEKLCTEQLCASKGVGGVEDFGYGKGYVYQAEEFGKLLNQLDRLRSCGVHVVLTAHASMRKFEQPDEMGAYDRWELKLAKKVAPLVKEWADMLLFANYKTFVVNVDGQGAKGKNKATGGKRVMYASHHPCWDAKNRFGLPDEMPFDYGQIAHLITDAHAVETVITTPSEIIDAAQAPDAPIAQAIPTIPDQQADVLPGIPTALSALMAANQVKPFEIQAVVAEKGYYPSDMPIADYDPDFISGVLVAAWPQVEAMILASRNKEPF